MKIHFEQNHRQSMPKHEDQKIKTPPPRCFRGSSRADPVSLSSSGNDSQDSNNDPNSSELELDDSEGGDSESESHATAESEAETSVQASPARDDTDKASFGNSDGNEAMAVEPNTSGLRQNNLIGDSVGYSLTHQK